MPNNPHRSNLTSRLADAQERRASMLQPLVVAVDENGVSRAWGTASTYVGALRIARMHAATYIANRYAWYRERVGLSLQLHSVRGIDQLREVIELPDVAGV